MNVLGNGYINLVDSMGDDLTIVNAARKSFGKHSGDFSPKDKKLLKYLWDNKHTSPFEMVEFMFEVKAPLFVVRQWQRHRTWSYNEVSRRYTSDDLDFYFPETWRCQDTDNKQASSGEVNKVAQDHATHVLWGHTKNLTVVYEDLIESGICREQARMILPQNMMVEMVAKTDLSNLLHFLRLRLHKHAQWEIQEYAKAIVELIEPVVPETIKLFKKESEFNYGNEHKP